MAIVDWIVAGGIVMLPLVIFSIATVALCAERARFWWKVDRQQSRLAKEVIQLYQEDPSLAKEKLERNLDLPLARIFHAPLQLDQATPEEFRLAMESEVQAEVPILRRFSNVFDAIVGLSPLLGLMGTVLGLITSFGSLNLGDLGGTRTVGVSAGISEALISTASGLFVAMFALVAASIFRALYQRQMTLIQEYGGQLELLYRRNHSRQDQQSATVHELSAALQQLVQQNNRSFH
jgi:biopolymer transport protein ExbB